MTSTAVAGAGVVTASLMDYNDAALAYYIDRGVAITSSQTLTVDFSSAKAFAAAGLSPQTISFPQWPSGTYAEINYVPTPGGYLDLESTSSSSTLPCPMLPLRPVTLHVDCSALLNRAFISAQVNLPHSVMLPRPSEAKAAASLAAAAAVCCFSRSIHFTAPA